MHAEPLLRPAARLVTVEFDHQPHTVPEGTYVLRAAEAAGVSIPSLCAHKELSPYGGCRLCMVEIEGMRGHPLACSTLVQDGMKVTTDTDALRDMRLAILQLILSEHPASCLVCGERFDCRRSLSTIRKTGVTTGCRSCPKDGVCELQAIVERLGVQDIGYPISYRGLEPEHDDPFYDRDYNLCILCGRCVRMCDEVRGTSVLAFTQRGPKSLVGPAFGKSHVAAGCEFCGACVSVCPTGALSDKVSKWDGAPDGFQTSTCPFCSLGCQIDIAHRDGRLSWVQGAYDTELNDGQLCVRGRFCLPETTHHHERARKPMLRRGAYFRPASWDEALSAVTERLVGVAPDEILTVISSDLSNEGLYAAQRFARTCLGSPNIDTTATSYLPGGAGAWSKLLSLPISLHDVAFADTVVVAGLDSRFFFSVVGVQARRAMRRGGKLIAVDARESNLAKAADEWVQPSPGDELQALIEVLRRPREAGSLAVVIAPRVFDCPGFDDLAVELERLGKEDGVTIVPLVQGTNSRGALEMGALAGVLPGPRPAEGSGISLADVWDGRPPRVLYLVGEVPFATRPDCEFIIAQDMYLPPFEVDVFLPAASFAEAEGTITNIEGRVQALAQIEDFPADAVHGFARPDWRIFSDLAGQMGHPELQYTDVAGVRAAIRAEVPGFPGEDDRSPRRMKPLDGLGGGTGRTAADGGLDGTGEFVLVPERGAFRHRGIDLAGVVEGLGELRLEQGARMSPADMDALGLSPGDSVTLAVDGLHLVLPAHRDDDCPAGAVYISTVEAWGSQSCAGDPTALERLSRLPARPTRVQVTPGVGGEVASGSSAPDAARQAVGEGGSHRG
jgi:predicted molibdopterin-dependent oxidoreductase YjgC